MTPPAGAAASTVPLTVSELLRLDPLAGSLVSHLAASDSQVLQVDLATSFDRLRRVAPHTLVVLGEEAASGGWSLATSIHLAWERAAAAVVLTAETVSASTTMLARRLDTTLLISTVDPVDLALTLAGQVSAPLSARALRVASCAEQLAEQSTIRGILAVLSRELDPLPVALVAGSTVLAGKAVALVERAGTHFVRLPVTTSSGQVFAELVTCIPEGSGDTGTVRSLLALGRVPILAAWAQGRLQPSTRAALERASFRLLRDATAPGLVSTNPVDSLAADASPASPPSWPGELGWRWDGINRAIWVTTAIPHPIGSAGLTELDALVHALWQQHLPQWPLAADEDGWVSWSNAPADRPAVVRQILRTLNDLLHGHGLVAGIGGPHEGADGLIRSTKQAQVAARVARTAGPGSIEWFDRIGVRAALGWLPIESLEHVAALCLGDLMSARDRRALISTSLAVLDNGGSLSLAAGTLGVHRNTVLARMARARELGLVADDPTQRLALHLLCFALETSWSSTTGQA